MTHHLVKQNRLRQITVLCLGIFLISQTGYTLADEPTNTIKDQRLFTSQKERSSLDKARLKYLSKDKKVPQRITVKKKPRPVPAVQMRGFIKRSDGKTTTWVNQGNTLKSRTVDRVKISKTPTAAGGVKVKLPNGKTVTLKPGQKYDPLTGRIKNIY